MSEGRASAPWWWARSLAECARAERDGAPGAGLAEAWHEDLPDPELLEERLRRAGVEPGELEALLAAARRAPPAGTAQPGWWTWIEAALGDPAPARDGGARDGRLLRGCLNLIRPLRLSARRELEAHARRRAERGAVPFEPVSAARLLARVLALDLVGLCSPLVALELGAALLAGDLPGDTDEQRSAAFMDELGRPARRRELMAGYPALARLLADRARLGTEAGRELLDRLAEDAARLGAELLGGAEPGRLVAAEPLGDSHDGGRRVLALTFDGGAELVYKPRSLATDLAWAGLLQALAEAGLDPAPGAPATLGAGASHGWQERVAPAACATRAQVGRYFERLGALLAVLHALRGVDLHQENVLACGEHPLVVDLEGLFHPRLGGERAAAVDPLVADTGMDCVLRVGLLPRADVAYGADISGLGRDPGAPALVDLPGGPVELAAEHNAVRLGEALVRPADWVDELGRGFAAAHRLLRRHRETWFAPGGPLAAFEGVEVRAIPRPSRVYAALIGAQAGSPLALADGLERERVLNRLWRGGARRPDLRRLAPAEHHDLWHGDIPKITGTPGGSDARHHALGSITAPFAPHRFEGPGCVRRLDERDERRQLAFLRGSVLAAAAPSEPGPRRPPRKAPAPSRALLLAAAQRCRERLELLALEDGEGRGWLAPYAADGHAGRVLRAAGPGLAEGQAGIALFLARVAEVSEERPDWSPAGRALALVPRRLPEAAEAGGVAWALALVARLTGERGLARRAVALVEQAPEGEDLSMRSGAAGVGVALAELLCLGEDVRERAGRCAALLVDAAPSAAAGLLDGDCGRALALHLLGDALGAGRTSGQATELARRAAGELTAGDDGSLASGSAGAAIVLAGLGDDDRDRLRACARHALGHGLGRDHSLAGGDLGVLVAVAGAARAAGDAELLQTAAALAGGVLDAFEHDGLGHADEALRPGLSGGLAGMGLAWLALAERLG